MIPGDFAACRAWIRPEEGLRSNDPDDPGGKTYEGVTQREYDSWCMLHGSPSGDVYKASEATITSIYQQQYWQPYCPLLPPGVALVFFDTNVNQGQGVAVTFLQQALGIIADARWGLVTAAHVKNINQPGGMNSKDIIVDMTAMRVHRYKGTRNFWKFGHDWLARAARCQAQALLMAGVS